MTLKIGTTEEGLSFQDEVFILVNHNQWNEPMNDKGITIPLRWTQSEDIVTQFADNVVVQFAPASQEADHFIVSFYQLQHPALFGEGDAKKAAEKGFIEAKCVAKLVLTPKTIKELQDVIRQNVEKFDMAKAQK